MADWSELKRLAEAAAQGEYESKQDWDDGDQFNVLAPTDLRVKAGPVMKTIATCNDPEQAEFFAAANPAAVLALIAENEALSASLASPDEVTAEPAGNYDALRLQFLALRRLANMKCRMAEHWRKQSDKETRETLLANAANVNAERDTNALLTDALEAAEAERDRLRAEKDRLLRLVDADTKEILRSADECDQLRAENERLGRVNSAMCSAMHAACMPVDADPAELADVIHRLQVNAERLKYRSDDLAKGGRVALELLEDAEAERDRLKAELEQVREYGAEFASLAERRNREIEALKAELERVRAALCEISGIVDGNIREIVRDLVNRDAGLNNGANPNDIYEECDRIDAAIDAAMGKGGRADG